MDETGTPKVAGAVTPRQLAAEAVERLEIGDPRGRRRDIAKRSLVLQEETKGRPVSRPKSLLPRQPRWSHLNHQP